jgi:hypothetical protein
LTAVGESLIGLAREAKGVQAKTDHR